LLRVALTMFLAIGGGPRIAPANASRPASAPATRPAVIRRPGLVVDLRRKEIRLSGRFALGEGIIELVACHKGTKDYESLLALDAKPRDLHFALLLIGLLPGGYEGKGLTPRGSGAKLTVEFRHKGEVRRAAPESFIYNDRDKKLMEPRTWVFVGSRMVRELDGDRERYWADITGAMVTTFLDESTVLENPGKHRDDDTVYVVAGDRAPPTGTKAVLVVTPAKEKKRDKPPTAEK